MSEDERAALRKRQQAERLRSAEKFMVVGSGEATCTSCGYQYKPENGDPEYPVARGTRFENLPEDWACPVCSSSKRGFRQEVKTIAGFAENQSEPFQGRTAAFYLLAIQYSVMPMRIVVFSMFACPKPSILASSFPSAPPPTPCRLRTGHQLDDGGPKVPPYLWIPLCVLRALHPGILPRVNCTPLSVA